MKIAPGKRPVPKSPTRPGWPQARPPQRTPHLPLPPASRHPARPRVPKVTGMGKAAGAAGAALLLLPWVLEELGYRPDGPGPGIDPGWARPDDMPDGVSAEEGTFQATIFNLTGWNPNSDHIYLHDKNDSAPFPSFQRRYWGAYPDNEPGTTIPTPVAPRWVPPELVPPYLPDQPYVRPEPVPETQPVPRQPTRPRRDEENDPRNPRRPDNPVRPRTRPRPETPPNVQPTPNEIPGFRPRPRPRERERPRNRLDPRDRRLERPSDPKPVPRPQTRPRPKKRKRPEVKLKRDVIRKVNRAWDWHEAAEIIRDITKVLNDDKFYRKKRGWYAQLTWAQKWDKIQDILIREGLENLGVGALKKYGKSPWTPLIT